MANSHVQFRKRVAELQRKHQALAEGYRPVVRSDGLIEVEPFSTKSEVSPRVFMVSLLTLLMFKAVRINDLGLVGYQEWVEGLASDNVVVQAGVWLLHADPVANGLVEMLKMLQI